MFKCTVEEKLGLKWVVVTGRIDGLSSPEIQQKIDDLILDGERTIITDLANATYISSAGIRVFLTAQKQLTKVSGGIVLFDLPQKIHEVFRMSGLVQLFTFAATIEEIKDLTVSSEKASLITLEETPEMSIRYLKKSSNPGSFMMIGSSEKLAASHYKEEDIQCIHVDQLQFATGLASLGEEYDEVKNLFGETVIINGNFFVYPAVKRPAVDFMLKSSQKSDAEYNFFHGFGFNGSTNYVMAFDSKENFIDLNALVSACFQISGADVIGIVLLGESKGLWGMHLRKAPIMENKPANDKNIFDSDNFTDWIDFPVEPSHANHTISGVGVAVRNKNHAHGDISKILAEGTCFHIHGAVFSKEPISKKCAQFEDELQRVLSELDVYKVQHLLGQSRFSSGMVGILELF